MSAIKSILTLEEVSAALNGSVQKGAYEREVKEFFESGEMARDFTELFPEKEEGNLFNNVSKYAKLQQIPFQVVKHENGDGDKKHILLINLDAYRLAQQTDEN
jgi:hypothetical protein